MVTIGGLKLGGDAPIRVQSMTNTNTNDTEGCVAQSIKIIEAGGELVRLTAQGVKEAENLKHIKAGLIAAGYHTPVVADIHFNARAAEVAALYADKVRINPGNFVDPVRKFEDTNYTDLEYKAEVEKIRNKFVPFLDICRQNNTAIRIGVNHGSLSDRIMSKYGDTPEGMVESCMEYLRIANAEDFHNIVISIKASNTRVMVHTVRLLVAQMEAEAMYYPLHLGVTEAGEGEDGRIKSAVGIGALLADGIGDTIRVSLSESPEKEIPVARSIVRHINRLTDIKTVQKVTGKTYSPFAYVKRTTVEVFGIGGTRQPVVVLGAESPCKACPEPFADVAFTTVHTKKVLAPIVDGKCQTAGAIPVFSYRDNLPPDDRTFAILVEANRVDEAFAGSIKNKKAVVLLSDNTDNVYASLRAAILMLDEAGCQCPVVVCRNYTGSTEEMQLGAALETGGLFLDGLADGLMITNTMVEPGVCISSAFAVLQAARVRMVKTEFISCPGCGRTLFDLEGTIAGIKQATGHLNHLKIGIMGCIVNGPGEMADADYGYVGAGRGKVSLYRGKNCVLKNIPEEDALPNLIELIKTEGDWVEPK